MGGTVGLPEAVREFNAVGGDSVAELRQCGFFGDGVASCNPCHSVRCGRALLGKPAVAPFLTGCQASKSWQANRLATVHGSQPKIGF